MGQTNAKSIPQQGLHTKKLSAVKRTQVEWLWPQRIPKSSITNITGDPGTGKGFLGAAIAAAFSTEGLLPGMNAPASPSNVLILAEEDDAGMVLRPRLEDMGADLDRIDIYTGYTNKQGESAQFDIRKFDELAAKIRELQADLVLFDPLLDFLGVTEINKAEKVKAMLQPLHRLAKDLRVSFVCVIHCNKGDVKALYKGSGSIQFAGQARSVFFLERSPENPQDKVLCHVKSNLGPLTPSLVYQIGQLNGDPTKPIVVWKPDDFGRWTAEDLLGDVVQAKTTKLETCKAFTEGMLVRGPLPTKLLAEECERRGFGASTQERAKSALGVISLPPAKTGPNAVYRVTLPGYEAPVPGLEEAPPTGVVPQDILTNPKFEELLKKIVSTCLRDHSVEGPLTNGGSSSAYSDGGLERDKIVRKLVAALNGQENQEPQEPTEE